MASKVEILLVRAKNSKTSPAPFLVFKTSCAVVGVFKIALHRSKKLNLQSATLRWEEFPNGRSLGTLI
jgi:hypothetical protein